MTTAEHNGHAGQDAPGTSPNGSTAGEEVHAETDKVVTAAATVGVVAVGAALFEVALLPGIALGVAAMLAPKYVPKLGSALTPMFRSSVRGVYKFGQKTNEMMAEAKEQVNDIVAEVKAETESEPPKAGKAKADAPQA